MSNEKIPYPTRMKMAKAIWNSLDLNKNKRNTNQGEARLVRGQLKMTKEEQDKAVRAGATVKNGFVVSLNK